MITTYNVLYLYFIINGSTVNKDFEQLTIHDGRIEFPDWASNVASILWIPMFPITGVI